MKNKTILAVMMAASVSFAITACNNSSTSATTLIETSVAQETEAATVATTVAETSAEATSAAETEAVTEESTATAETKYTVEFETISESDIDPAIYEMTNGEWHYAGIQDEKFMDMDGFKGLTTYTAEAKPANEGYLRYLGENPDGLHVFDVYDLYGRQFMTLTFVSEEQFYVNGDEENYYVKWDY